VAPFLIDLAGDPMTPDRSGVLRLLAAPAIGFDRWWLPATYPVAEVRRDVERKAGLTVEGLQQELDAWVAEHAVTHRRSLRPVRHCRRGLVELARDDLRDGAGGAVLAGGERGLP
jgi:hypothetical protein